MSRATQARLRERLRTRGVLYFLAAPAALVALLVSCQILVPADVPSYTCTGTDPSSCPASLVCDPARGICVPPDSVIDGSKPDGPTQGPDGGPDRDTGPPLAPLGGPCGRDADCAEGLICGTQSILTSAITTDTNVCTKPCCTTADCAAGFICYPPGTGGNYCVAAALAGRSPPETGGGLPGATCTDASDCRSGLCTNQRCLDTCCNNDPCTNGTICRYTEGPSGEPVISGHHAFGCALPIDGGLDNTATCDDTRLCLNDNCAPGVGINERCTPTCCNASDCTKAGFVNNICTYGLAPPDQLKWCFEPVGGAADGQPCSVNTECATRYCDKNLLKCARPCCQTSDCNAGESCKPADNAFLRCITNAN